MVHVGIAAALLDHIDRRVGEAHRRVSEGQAQHALLRAGRPGDDAAVVVDVVVGDAEARHHVDDAHGPVLQAGIAEALEIVNAPAAGLPMGHEGPHRLMLGEGLIDDVAGDRLAMRHLDNDDAFRFWVERIGGQLLARRGLHADGETIDAAERSIGEGHDRVAGEDHAQHAIEAAEARATDAVGVDVLGAERRAQHMLGLDHAAQDVLLHVVGHAGLGEALEHARVRVSGTGAGGKSFGNFQARINFHLTSPNFCLA